MARDAVPGAGYSIAAASKLTGISCHTLRVWERRYGYPVPGRAPSGHRRYGAEQVGQLLQVAAQVRAGRPVGLVMADLAAGRLGSASQPAPQSADARRVAALLDRLALGDLVGADREFGRLTDGLEVREQIDGVFEPALIETGERWFRGEYAVHQERCASGFLRRKLALLMVAAQTANGAPAATALVGTLPGERHEGGVLIVGLLLELAGWRAIPMGTELPADEFQRAIDRWRPSAVCVSFVLSRNINKRFRELAALRGAPVFVGGRSILNYRTLARRHGLVPLPGAATTTLPGLIRAAWRGPPGHAPNGADVSGEDC